MTDDTSALDQGAPRVPTAVLIVIAVLGAALVFTTTLAVLQWRHASDVEHKEDLRKGAAATAAQFGAALYTYDFNDLAAARQRALQFATANYAKAYDASAKAQQDTITRLKARQTAKTTGVFLTDVVKDKVAAVVILDTALQSPEGNRKAVTHLDVALVRQGSAWKVSAARPVG